MQEDTLLVCRNAFYLDSLNINDLTLRNLPGSTVTRLKMLNIYYWSQSAHILGWLREVWQMHKHKLKTVTNSNIKSPQEFY